MTAATIGLSFEASRPQPHHSLETRPVTGQRTLIVAAVILAHIAGLWALHSGLMRRAVEVVIPVAVLADVIEMAAPQPVAQPAKPQTTPTPPQRTPQKPAPLKPAPPTMEQARPSPAITPTPSDVTTEVAAAPEAPPALAVPAPRASSPPAPTSPPVPPSPPASPAPPKIEPPSSAAAYLNNPQPAYPKASVRLGEQGLVVVRTLINTDGTAQRAEVKTSSGFERLDKLAVETVLKWRYVPGKRDGEPEAMWFDVPIHFQLK